MQPGDGRAQITREFGQRNVQNCQNPLAGDNFCFLNAFRGLTQTRNYSVYLRDSWQVDWAPGLVLNLGVRWEGQEIYKLAVRVVIGGMTMRFLISAGPIRAGVSRMFILEPGCVPDAVQRAARRGNLVNARTLSWRA